MSVPVTLLSNSVSLYLSLYLSLTLFSTSTLKICVRSLPLCLPLICLSKDSSLCICAFISFLHSFVFNQIFCLISTLISSFLAAQQPPNLCQSFSMPTKASNTFDFLFLSSSFMGSLTLLFSASLFSFPPQSLPPTFQFLSLSLLWC